MYVTRASPLVILKKTDRDDASRSDPVAVAPTCRRRCRRPPTGVARPHVGTHPSARRRPFRAPHGRYAPVAVAPRSVPAAAVAVDRRPESCEPSACLPLRMCFLSSRWTRGSRRYLAGTRSPSISPSISVVLVTFHAVDLCAM